MNYYIFMKRVSVTGLKRNRQVKDYICTHFCSDPAPMAYALALSKEAGLKAIQVPQNVAKLLSLISRLIQPKRVLEIGTLGGYSTLWLAEGLAPDGQLITIESDPLHVEVAKRSFAYAGKEKQITILQGNALDICKKMIENKEEPFDLIFIDADKSEYPFYLEQVLQLSRPGTAILSDNLIPKRGVIGCPDPRDNEAVAIYKYNQILADHPHLETVPITTIVGEKGRIDSTGLTIVL